MHTVKLFFVGLNSHLRAIQVINRTKLWPTIIGSAIFNLFVFIFIGIIAWIYSSRLIDNLYQYFNIEDLEQGYQITAFIAKITIILALVVLYFYLYKYIILLLFSPVLAFVSEKVHKKLAPQQQTLQIGKIVRDIIRGMVMGLILLSFQLAVFIATFLLSSLIPYLSPIFLIIMLLIESFVFGAGLIDYSNEHEGLSISDSIQVFLKNKISILGNGIGFNLLLLIPVIGPLLAPPIGVVAGAYLSKTLIH